MSYLSPLRVHFAGAFVASPSTLNNLPANYDVSNPNPDPLWNPDGDHQFTLECTVTAARLDDVAVAAPDAVLTARLTQTGRFVSKLVDLDPHQQMVSMIFGMTVALTTPAGALLVRGAFVPAPFADLWNRGTTGPQDARFGAMYQSVLEAVEWGDVSGSPFLQRLRAASSDRLSIKFNVDGYSMDSQSPNFTRGRLVGTIGPADEDAPAHFIAGRHFAQPAQPRSNVCVAVLDEAARKVRIDLGNALQSAPSGGPAADVGTLSLVCLTAAPGQPLALGDIAYQAADWYTTTAGIVDVPAGRLTDAQLALVRDRPLALVARPAAGPAVVLNREPEHGVHARADMFVFRMNPGDAAEAAITVTRRGGPLGGAALTLQHLSSAEPSSALTFPATLTTGADGQATVVLRASDPGHPREFIDGQVYEVGYAVDGLDAVNRDDTISVLVWDAFVPDEPPTWFGSMAPIFGQYSHLYPMMREIVDLADYSEISARRTDLIEVLVLADADPHYMPVTRDLSTAKREAMIRWLTNVGPDGKPLKGIAPAGDQPVAVRAVPRAVRARAPHDEPVGGKAHGMQIRDALRRKE